MTYATAEGTGDALPPFEQVGLVVWREADGTVRANVPLVRYHGLEFNCGYGGSGPADLALATLAALLPPPTVEDEEATFDLEGPAFEEAIADPSRWSERVGLDGVRVSKLALALHQAFKWQFIATMDARGGTIPIGDIKSWVDEQKQQLRAA